MDSLKDIFIHNLKNARSRKNLSQADLAERTDLSTGFIGDIETGRASPSFQRIEIIAAALDIEPFMLFIDPDTMQSIESYQLDYIMEDVREALVRYFVPKDES